MDNFFFKQKNSRQSVENAAAVIATEARAIYNEFRKKGIYENFASISCFAPFINIVRHPLWGRIQEVYGEDPYLSGQIASAFVQGLHGTHKRYVKASSGCKVVSAHSGPENIPQSRLSFNSKVTERDLRLTFLPNVEACIEAGTFNLMCSYNRLIKFKNLLKRINFFVYFSNSFNYIFSSQYQWNSCMCK